MDFLNIWGKVSSCESGFRISSLANSAGVSRGSTDRIVRRPLTNKSRFCAVWKAPKIGKVKGYYILCEKLLVAGKCGSRKFFTTENILYTFPIPKDNYFFAGAICGRKMVRESLGRYSFAAFSIRNLIKSIPLIWKGLLLNSSLI